MASKPRRRIVDPLEVMVYHCYNTCSRQAFHLTDANDSSERLEWLRSMEELLASLFAIDVCFHAELDNIFHVVLRSRPDIVAQMTDEEVARRWLIITKLKRCGTSEIDEPSPKSIRAEMKSRRRIKKLRTRLSHVSWFMGTLSENISRRINRADGTKGTIWASRYQCERLPDEASILIGGLFVDLDVIRAGRATTQEESTHTSAFERIRGLREAIKERRADGWLVKLSMDSSYASDSPERLRSTTGRRASDDGLLSLSVAQYFELLEWATRRIAGDVRAALSVAVESMLDRIGLTASRLMRALERIPRPFAVAALKRLWADGR